MCPVFVFPSAPGRANICPNLSFKLRLPPLSSSCRTGAVGTGGRYGRGDGFFSVVIIVAWSGVVFISFLGAAGGLTFLAAALPGAVVMRQILVVVEVLGEVLTLVFLIKFHPPLLHLLNLLLPEIHRHLVRKLRVRVVQVVGAAGVVVGQAGVGGVGHVRGGGAGGAGGGGEDHGAQALLPPRGNGQPRFELIRIGEGWIWDRGSYTRWTGVIQSQVRMMVMVMAVMVTNTFVT